MKNTTYAEQIRYLTLLLGVIQVTFGCFVGFIPPTAVLWFRGIVMAHIEFTANGVLLVVLGLQFVKQRTKSKKFSFQAAFLLQATQEPPKELRWP